ncbi:MAG: hypothetical protein KGI10_01740 [Thaumarchaeota archaeon]|nr:hypothetical protein [Nitrososphaerota archaeon]
MNKTILSIMMTVVVLILFSTSMAYATNHNTSIFSDATRYADSNTYKNTNYSFSIQPPLNWVIVNNLPLNMSNQAIVIFSNNDKSQLATFGIYHRHITQNVIDVINSHPDNDILATIDQEITSPTPDSQTKMYSGVVDRFNDGIRVSASSVTRYTADNSTSFSEDIFYYLNNGNQYTLALTSKPTNIDKNSQLFEDSANTFLVNQANPVPEFPIALITLVTGMFSIILIFRIKGLPER